MALSWSLFGVLTAMCVALVGALYVLIGRIDSLGADLRGEIRALRTELRGDVQELRGELRANLRDVDRRLRGGGL